MNTRYPSRWSWLVLFMLVVVLPFFAASGATQTAPQNNSSVKTTNGLTVVTFAIDPGKIILNLPDDLRAGDTISGTVVEEPKGTTAAEKEKNKSVLEGMVIDLEGTKVPVRQPHFTWIPPTLPPGAAPRYQLRIIEVSTPGSSGSQHVYSDCMIQTYNFPRLSASGSENLIEKPEIKIPPLGQTGRPIVITGAFDGNSDNTIVTVGDQTLAPLAESPRRVVFESPSKVTGPVGISVKEGGAETKGPYRNVGVNLTAPKTSLKKGESTELRVEVQGLQGITQPIPLHLTNGGAVTMQGGNTQTMSIKPSDVQSNGIYTTTRTITGVQAGLWNATATVVVFDVCLQDDTNGDLLTFSSTTGDYIFCQSRSGPAGPNPITVSTLNFLGTDFSGGARVPAGDVNQSGGSPANPVNIEPGASITRTAAITVGDFNYKIGYIHVQIDDYSHTGNASGYVYQQITVPSNASPKKINFTITDRDTRNNTCACK
jgi:IPT/TIG domain-containing protein